MQRGAQYTYSDQAIEMALTIRSLLNLPLRQTQGFIQSVLVLMGRDDLLVIPQLYDPVASSRTTGGGCSSPTDEGADALGR